MPDEAQDPHTTQGQVDRGGVPVPRWVKVFALVVLAVALLLLAHMILRAGSDGPSLHGGSALHDLQTAIVDVGSASA